MTEPSLAAPLEHHAPWADRRRQRDDVAKPGEPTSGRVILQFGLDRDINGAAQDVQAAINAAQADLPTNLLSQPTYRKVNPADAPVLILGLTSSTLTRGQMYDTASNVLQQQLSQISGVGQVIINGSALPAVRVDVDPMALSRYGVGRRCPVRAVEHQRRCPRGRSISAASAGGSIPTIRPTHATTTISTFLAYPQRRRAAAERSSAETSKTVQDLEELGALPMETPRFSSSSSASPAAGSSISDRG